MITNDNNQLYIPVPKGKRRNITGQFGSDEIYKSDSRSQSEVQGRLSDSNGR